jgi:predicted nicotinamide N-methyase
MKSITDILLSPWTNQVLFTAIRLRIFTIFADESMTLEEISSRLETATHYLRPFLDACVCMDLILCQDGQYRNSQFSRAHLVEGEPEYIGDAIQLMVRESEQWDKLYDLISSSDHDSSDQNQGGVDPRLFTLAMKNIGMLGEAEALGNAIDLSGCKRMVDAGGGSGLYSLVLCRKYPELSSTVFDRRDPLMTAREVITGSEEESRIELVEADISKDPLGNDTDVVLLSDVVYERSFAEKVLKNANRSLSDNGLLIVRGYYSDPENSKPLFGALFRLNQIMVNPERSYLTLLSLHELVTDMGFTIMRVAPLTELSFLMLARKQIPNESLAV